MEVADTRELRYFVAVAEEGHFGRAARRLGIAQPPLSRAIGRLERRMGGPLLRRGREGATVTAAGEVLLGEARRTLDAAEAATRRTRRAARPRPTLVLAMKPGGDAGLLSDILAAFAADPAAVDVEIAAAARPERTELLRDGRADVALVYRHVSDLAGLDTEDLVREPQVALLSAGHSLARRERLHTADLDGDPAPRWPGPASKDALPAEDAAHLMQLVALGRVTAVVPESVRARAWADVACVPVVDAADTTLALAWPAESRSRAVAAFARAAETAATERGRCAPHAEVRRE